MSNNLQLNDFNEGLHFLSLGGIGEIGANCYLYGCDGKWIMIDLGLSFADEKFPSLIIKTPPFPNLLSSCGFVSFFLHDIVNNKKINIENLLIISI